MIGERIRQFREQERLSQTQLAKRIPISQKQVSRIEMEEFVQLPRHTVIRISEVLRTPILSGEVNQWLARFGYAPLIRPRLPLPPSLEDLVQGTAQVPAFCFDAAWNLRAANGTGTLLLDLPSGVQEFNLATFAASRPPSLDARDRHRLLFWQMALLKASVPEPWQVDCCRQIEEAAGSTWDALWAELSEGVPAVGYWPAHFHLKHKVFGTLRFRPAIAQLPLRPDLYVLHLYPDNPRTREWADKVAHPGRSPIVVPIHVATF